MITGSVGITTGSVGITRVLVGGNGYGYGSSGVSMGGGYASGVSVGIRVVGSSMLVPVGMGASTVAVIARVGEAVTVG